MLCDPFKVHKRFVTKGLSKITEQNRANDHHLHFRPNDKLCTSCRKQLADTLEPVETSTHLEESSPACDEDSVNEQIDITMHPVKFSNDGFVSPDHELPLLNQSSSLSHKPFMNLEGVTVTSVSEVTITR